MSDVDITAYIWKFLVREFRWQWNHRSGRSKKRSAFMWGVYLALATKLQQRAPKQQPGIVVHEQNKRDEYMAQEFGDTTSVKLAPKERGRAVENGYRAGKDIEIRPGVKAGQRAPASPALPNQERKLLQPSAGQLGLL